ncbi:MAG TPA: hypothetical protein VMS96_06210 [Terriglobales bacterium]|nr:hypothetical protein [Terriglobales bacterium]
MAWKAPQPETRLLASLATVTSLLAYLAFQARDQVLLSGDAVAHIGIARRVVDSLTPGPAQFGTVWLPLQHLLTVPFVASDALWRSGAAGSLPSMFGYVLAVVGVFRLVRSVLAETAISAHASAAGWFAALVLGANPNLIYVQATALNESLYLAEFIWALVFLSDFARRLRHDDENKAVAALRRCAMVLAAAILTRYDGWALTILCGIVMLVVLGRRPGWAELARPAHASLRRATICFVLLGALTPALWMAYNYGLFQDPLEFARGPYSAKAILERTTPAGAPRHPGYHDMRVAAVYFLKCTKLDLAGGRWEPWLLLLAAAGTVIAIALGRWIWLLLWLPLPFYAFSIAYEAVPIFLPVWWPFSYYNTRYGLQSLPAVATFTAVAMAYALARTDGRRWQAFVPLTFGTVLVGSYLTAWGTTPITLREAMENSRTRIAYEKALAHQLEELPATARLLMFVGDHVDALRRAGVPLRRVVNESNYPLWQQAMEAPAGYADYVIASDGGPVAEAVARHPQDLEMLLVITSTGQPRTTIYGSRAAIKR